MAIRVYKRTSAGRRNASVNLYSEVTKKRPEKSLLRAKPKHGGRNRVMAYRAPAIPDAIGESAAR